MADSDRALESVGSVVSTGEFRNVVEEVHRRNFSMESAEIFAKFLAEKLGDKIVRPIEDSAGNRKALGQ